MRGKFLGVVFAAIVFAVVLPAEVKAVDYETALKLQQEASDNYYALLQAQAGAANAVNQQIQDTVAAQQAALKAQQDAALAQQQALAQAVAAQQQAALDAMTAQQKAALEAANAAQQQALKAQQSAMEAAAAIQTASLTTPQVGVICDTNCAEQNAVLYSQSVPDFVLVDISEQRAIFYRNGVRVLGDNCVTGNKRAGYDTTVGLHKIIFKDLNRTLHGSYGEAFVKYWMRFTNGGQGLHDAGWRSTFGQGIYISNGSHGCVNLPRETAKIIFENSYVGMFVIVEN